MERKNESTEYENEEIKDTETAEAKEERPAPTAPPETPAEPTAPPETPAEPPEVPAEPTSPPETPAEPTPTEPVAEREKEKAPRETPKQVEPEEPVEDEEPIEEENGTDHFSKIYSNVASNRYENLRTSYIENKAKELRKKRK